MDWSWSSEVDICIWRLHYAEDAIRQTNCWTCSEYARAYNCTNSCADKQLRTGENKFLNVQDVCSSIGLIFKNKVYFMLSWTLNTTHCTCFWCVFHQRCVLPVHLQQQRHHWHQCWQTVCIKTIALNSVWCANTWFNCGLYYNIADIFHQNLEFTHTHTRLTALFPGLPGWEVCTSLQTE